MSRAASSLSLDPLRFPLHGARLIEASAGTGKTYTIAALYLRLVVGHGGEHAFPQPLMPPQILVVTFTDAATQELRDRIRARLAQAAVAFQQAAERLATDGEAGPDEADPLLRALLEDCPPSSWARSARWLQAAAQQMDEAAVSTIHGWCQRMLREHAFVTDSLFTQTLQTDLDELLIESVRDYWRVFLYALDERDARRVCEWWSGPDSMAKLLKRLLPWREQIDDGSALRHAPSQLLGEARERADRALAELKAPWRNWLDEVRRLLDDACARKLVDGRRLRRDYYGKWLDELHQWAHGPSAVEPALNTGWTRLTRAGLMEVFKTGEAPPHPAWEAIETLRSSIKALPDGYDALVRHATAWVANRFEQQKARQAVIGFDDLLSRLDRALQSPQGPALAAMIRQQFPVALIDEFQDTNPEQYRIFSAVYGVDQPAADGDDSGLGDRHGARTSALVLIGDPKQAIYAFRGADIHTYLRARAQTEGQHYTLATNYRSTPAMVAAVNAWFEAGRDAPDGRGAFMAARDGHDPMPFVSVDAHGRRERWVVDGIDAPAMTCWTLSGGKANKGDYGSRMADATAAEIARLLALAAESRAGFIDGDGVLRPLQPSDIAVLVNNGFEARNVRRALSRVGQRSVYLSDQGSVFDTPQAQELLSWLRACAAPGDDRLLRAALASASLGLDWDALERLNSDELQWEAQVERWRAYRTRWQRQGVLPMIRHLLHDFAVPSRLLARGDERGLTDLLHLAELLQQASALLDGEQALIRHLVDAMQLEGRDDTRRQRLESDENLVKVVTVHKSKGLEYSLVFVPFAASYRCVDNKALPVPWHDEHGQSHWLFEDDAALLRRADDDRLAEDLRKFYVALTRARYATWIGLAPVDDFSRSAPGRLLGAPQDATTIDLSPLGNAVVNGDLPDSPTPLRDDARATRSPLAPAAPLKRAPSSPWWIASFSALLRAGLAEERDADTADDWQDSVADARQETFVEAAVEALRSDRLADDEEASSVDASTSAVAAIPTSATAPAVAQLDLFADTPVSDEATGDDHIHDFPRGPAPGSFLHELLEWAGRQGFDAVCGDPQPLSDWLARRCAAHDWQAWQQPLQRWLLGLLQRPLPLAGSTLRLADLPASAYLVEMEFWFSASQTNVARIDRCVTRHTLDGASRPPLGAVPLQGMLKGFIDLVFEHQGRYYVADYKSNWLGPDTNAYTRTAMARAVASHRYDLQYALYLFALHRLLRSRLPDYDYDRHVGGAVYLFVRACDSEGAGVFVDRPPRALINELDRLFEGPSS